MTISCTLSHDEDFALAFSVITSKAIRIAIKQRIPDPEAFVQDCLIEYLQSASKKKLVHVNESYVFRIVGCRAKDFWRGQKRVGYASEISVEAIDGYTARKWTRSINCGNTASKLPPWLSGKAKDILHMKFVELCPDREIANAMNMTPSGVQSSIKRSRARAAAYLPQSNSQSSLRARYRCRTTPLTS